MTDHSIQDLLDVVGSVESHDLVGTKALLQSTNEFSFLFLIHAGESTFGTLKVSVSNSSARTVSYVIDFIYRHDDIKCT